MRHGVIVSTIVIIGCGSEAMAPSVTLPPPPPPAAPLFSRTFCLQRVAIEDQAPGSRTLLSEPDSLAGGCAQWTFGSNTDNLLMQGSGALSAVATVSVHARVYDSSVSPPTLVEGWVALLRPGVDEFSFTRDPLDRLQFDGVRQVNASNWWPFIGWWLDPTQAGANASYWHGDSITTRLHVCYSADCRDHFFVDATWRRTGS